MSVLHEEDAPIALIGASAVLLRRHAALAEQAGWPTRRWRTDGADRALADALREAAGAPTTAAMWLNAVTEAQLADALDALATVANTLPVVWTAPPPLGPAHVPAPAWLAAHGVLTTASDVEAADALATLIGVDPPVGGVVGVFAEDDASADWLARDLHAHGLQPVTHVVASRIEAAWEASFDARFDAVIAHVPTRELRNAGTPSGPHGAPWVAVVDALAPGERDVLMGWGAVASLHAPGRALRWLQDWASADGTAPSTRVDAGAVRQAVTATLQTPPVPRAERAATWLRALGIPRLASSSVTYVDDVIVEAASHGYPIRVEATLDGVPPQAVPPAVVCANVEQLEANALRLFTAVRNAHGRPPQLALSRPLERAVELDLACEVHPLYGPVLTVSAGPEHVLDVREPDADALAPLLRAAGLEPDALRLAGLRGACGAAIAACHVDARIRALRWTLQIGAASYGASQIHVELV